MSKTYLVNCQAPDIQPGDIKWSKVFRKARRFVPSAEFLCYAIDGVIKIGTPQNIRMKAYICALIEGEGTLEGWLVRVAPGIYAETERRDPGLVRTRKAWALALAEQFERAGL